MLHNCLPLGCQRRRLILGSAFQGAESNWWLRTWAIEDSFNPTFTWKHLAPSHRTFWCVILFSALCSSPPDCRRKRGCSKPRLSAFLAASVLFHLLSIFIQALRAIIFPFFSCFYCVCLHYLASPFRKSLTCFCESLKKNQKCLKDVVSESCTLLCSSPFSYLPCSLGTSGTFFKIQNFLLVLEWGEVVLYRSFVVLQ